MNNIMVLFPFVSCTTKQINLKCVFHIVCGIYYIVHIPVHVLRITAARA